MAAPERFLIWGAGGHARVVADVIRAAGGAVAGLVDRDPARVGEAAEPGGARVLLAEAELLERLASGTADDARWDRVALGVGDNARRLELRRLLGGRCAPALVHPRATVSPSARLGEGTVVMPGVVVNAAARVGEAVILNSCAVVEHDCVVGDGAHLSPGSVLTGGSRAGSLCWIGAGAVVIDAHAVGDGARVGAGAVVNRDVPPGVTVVGVPARVLPA